jgi:hypothetical protein
MIKELATRPRLPIRFYMDVGLWETADMLMPNRILRSVLDGKGYEVAYREFTGGHDYVVWRGTLSDGLVALIGTKSAKSKAELALVAMYTTTPTASAASRTSHVLAGARWALR